MKKIHTPVGVFKRHRRVHTPIRVFKRHRRVISFIFIFLLLFQFMTPVLALTVVNLPKIIEGDTVFKEDIDDTEIIYYCDEDNYITKTHIIFLFTKTDDNKTVNITTQYANISYRQDVTFSFLTYYKYTWYIDVFYTNESGDQHFSDNYNGVVLLGSNKVAIAIETDLVWIGHGWDLSRNVIINESIIYPSTYVHVKSDVEILESNIYYTHESRLIEDYHIEKLSPIFKGIFKVVTLFVSDTGARYSILQFLTFFSSVFTIIFFILKYLIFSPIFLFISFQGCAMLYSVATSEGDYMRAMKTLMALNVVMIKAVSSFITKLFTMFYQVIEGLKFW